MKVQNSHLAQLFDPLSQYVLKPCREEHAEAIYEAAIESFEHVSEWMPWLTPSYTLEDTIAWTLSASADWESEARFEFVIIDSENGDLCGVCGLNQINRMDLVCNLGYWVRKSKLQQGVATSAARMLKAFGLEAQRFARIEIVVADGNTASRKVAENVGAIYEGIQRKRLRAGGISRDAHMYALLSEINL